VNGNATAGPSRSRPRPIDLDDDDDGDSRPAAQRRRVSPPNDDEVVTSAMRESSISDHPYGMDMDMDEEEMMRRAMEESLREVAAPRPAASPVPQSRVEQPHWRPKSLAPAPKAAAGGVPASGSGGSALGGAPTNEGDEDDSPSVEECVADRLDPLRRSLTSAQAATSAARPLQVITMTATICTGSTGIHCDLLTVHSARD
jgi:hypothetical protein